MEDRHQLLAAEENEIILDLNPTIMPSPPNIIWKVQNGSAIRSGEILAQYSPACVTRSSNSNSNSNSTSTSAVASSTCSGTSAPVTNNNISSSNGTTGDTNAKRKIIRPKRRNRGMLNKKNILNSKNASLISSGSKPSVHNVNANANGDGTSNSSLQMEDVMKSFGKNKIKSSSNNSNSSTNNNTNTISNNRTKNGEPEKKNGDNEKTASTGNTKLEKLIPIKANMDGIVEIYSSIKRCSYIPPSEKGNEDDGDGEKVSKRTSAKKVKKAIGRISKVVFVLGKIEPCQHPAVIDGLCAVCGQSVLTSSKKTNIRVPQSMPTSMYSTSSRNNSNNKSSNTIERDEFTTAGGFTVSVTKKEAESSSQNKSKNLRAAKKLNLVLDLDHTLLHATADKRAIKWMLDDSKKSTQTPDLHVVLLPLMEGHPLYELQQQKQQSGASGGVQVWQPHYVKLRPHLAEFIIEVMDRYEITIYTAGTRTYAHKIADVISRHALDYRRRKGGTAGDESSSGTLQGQEDPNGKNESNTCLDEGELNDLRQKVSRLEDRMRWDKSRKERQEYVKRMNEKFEQEKKKDVSKDEDSVKDEDGVPPKPVEKSTINDKESKDESEKPKKRRRVTFTESVITKDDKMKNDATMNEEKKQQNVEISSNQEEDPSLKLEQVKAQLAAAEEREGAAQALRKKIFGSRIYSRTDLPDLGRDVKSLKRISTCGGKMAAVVDDREDVWANADNNSTGRKGEPPHNLLLVKPYHFAPFLNFSDVNNASGKDLSEEKSDGKKKTDDTSKDSEDNQLLWTGDILSRLHSRFYDPKLSEEERDKLDVPSILTKMRREVLSQCNPQTKVMLSGLVPLHLQNFDSRNETRPRHDVIRYAEELGAKVMTKISNEITHVIAAKDGTDKILQARRIPGCAIVQINWLMECYWSITKRDVEPHYLGPPPIPRQNLNGGESKTKLLLSGSDSEDEDEDEDEDEEDDDIVMEFKRRMNELQSK